MQYENNPANDFRDTQPDKCPHTKLHVQVIRTSNSRDNAFTMRDNAFTMPGKKNKAR